MNFDFDIFSESQNGERLKLLFSQSFLMLKKDDKIEIKLPSDANDWKLKIDFTDEESDKEFTAKTKVIDNTLYYSLNKWYSKNWVENTKPIKLESLSQKTTLFLKLRTTADMNYDFRLVHLSIWQKI